MTNSRPDLEQLAEIANTKGRHLIVGVCRKALAHIAALEAELERTKGKARRGAQTRMARLTPGQRSTLAKVAAQRRWHPGLPPHASG